MTSSLENRIRMFRIDCILFSFVVVVVLVQSSPLASGTVDEALRASSSEGSVNEARLHGADQTSSSFELGETSDPIRPSVSSVAGEQNQDQDDQDRLEYETSSGSIHEADRMLVDQSNDLTGLVGSRDEEVDRFIASSTDGAIPARGESVDRARFEIFDKKAPKRNVAEVYEKLNYLKKALESQPVPRSLMKRSKIINLIELAFYKPESCRINELFDRKQMESAFDGGTNIRRFLTYHNNIQFDLCYDHLKNLISTNINDLPDSITIKLNDMRKEFKKYQNRTYALLEFGIDQTYPKAIVRFISRTMSNESNRQVQIKQLMNKTAKGIQLSESERTLFAEQYDQIMGSVCRELSMITHDIIGYFDQLRYLDERDLRKVIDRKTANWLTSARICQKYARSELSVDQILANVI